MDAESLVRSYSGPGWTAPQRQPGDAASRSARCASLSAPAASYGLLGIGRRMASRFPARQVDSPSYWDLKTNRRIPAMTGRALFAYSVEKRWMSVAATSSGNAVSIQSIFSVQGGVVREPSSNQ